MSEELVYLNFSTVKKLIKNKLMSAGLDEVQAEAVADHLAYADAHGVHSHGAVRVEYYSERIAKGGTTANPNIQFKKTGTSVGMLDGDNALGHYVAMLGAEKAIELAQETGIGVVGMKRMGHAGTLSYYIRKATEQGLIMLSMCQSDPMVVLYGGTEPYFGTNPIGFGAPAKNSPPIVFDMATTVGAWGKILDARSKGNSIPDTWAVDNNGNPTTDPNKVAGLVPIAGAKGSGLMFMVDILAGILVGQPSGKHVSSMYSNLSAGRELGHLHIVLNPDYFTSKEYVMEAVENMIKEIHSMKPAQGLSSVRYPGEGQAKRADGYAKNGIPIVKDIYEYLLSDDVHYNRYEGMNAFAEDD